MFFLAFLRDEIRIYEQDAIATVIRECDVILGTLVGATRFEIRDVHFDVAIIDEAAQALEVGCWIPMLKANRVVLAGGKHTQKQNKKKSKKLSYY